MAPRWGRGVDAANSTAESREYGKAARCSTPAYHVEQKNGQRITLMVTDCKGKAVQVAFSCRFKERKIFSLSGAEVKWTNVRSEGGVWLCEDGPEIEFWFCML
ncbi:hypothetical protein EJB05_07457, partial [Eragrostis curvula]